MKWSDFSVEVSPDIPEIINLFTIIYTAIALWQAAIAGMSARSGHTAVHELIKIGSDKRESYRDFMSGVSCAKHKYCYATVAKNVNVAVLSNQRTWPAARIWARIQEGLCFFFVPAWFPASGRGSRIINVFYIENE